MRALAALAPGLLFFSLQKALTPAFYALKDTSTPLRVALWGVGMNFVMNVAFVLTWPDGWKHVGLMLSTVLVSIINTVALTQELHKRIGAPRTPVLAPTAAGVAVATYLYSEDLFIGAVGALLSMAPLLTAYLRRRPLGILVRPSRKDAAAAEEREAGPSRD